MATQAALTRLTKPVLVERLVSLTKKTEEATEKQIAAAVLGTVVGLLLGAALF